MVIKGGILLAIRYQSNRYTRDIDFSTDQLREQINTDEITEKLNNSMAVISEQLDYGMSCRVQSCQINPSHLQSPHFPSVKISIGYAYKSDSKHKRLMANRCPTTIDIDYSLNEATLNIEEMDIGCGHSLMAYALPDLIAEKFRALLQQQIRGRHRRQDIFDICLLLRQFPNLSYHERCVIIKSLIQKANSRGIEARRESLGYQDIYLRSKALYPTLADEIESELPDFDEIYTVVQEFYESLPWDEFHSPLD